MALEVSAIQAEAAARNDVTIDEITSMLLSAFETTGRRGNPSAMARLNGFLIKKRQTVNVTRSTADIDDRIRAFLAACDERAPSTGKAAH